MGSEMCIRDSYTTIAILISLLEREQSGEGQWVHTSLLESMISMLDFQAARWTVAGDVAPQAGNNHPTTIPTGVFKTSDGHINIASAGDIMWVRLCEVLGDPAMANNPDFIDGAKRSENRDAVNASIEAHTVNRTSAEWIEALEAAGVPCGPIYRIDQMFADPQVQHVGMTHPVSHDDLGDMNLVGQPINMSRFQPRTGMPTPKSGQHTDEVLAEYGYDTETIAELRAKGIV